MKQKRKEINSIIEPQFSSEGGGMAKQTRSIDINPNHSKSFFHHRTVQVQELLGSFQINLKGEDVLPSAVNIFNVSLQKNTSFVWKPPQDHNVMIFVFQGRGIFGPYAGEDELLVPRYQLLLFGEGDEIYARTEDTPLRFLVITGSNK